MSDGENTTEDRTWTKCLDLCDVSIVREMLVISEGAGSWRSHEKGKEMHTRYGMNQT